MMMTQGAHLFVRTQTNGSRTYLLIADNVRVDGKLSSAFCTSRPP
jgi:allophanate hydrolase subunit 2